MGSVEIPCIIINHRCTQINADVNKRHLRASVFICGYGSKFIDNQDFYRAIIPRKYTQHQLMTLFLLKEYLDEDYRDIAELVELLDEIKSKIGIKQCHLTNS